MLGSRAGSGGDFGRILGRQQYCHVASVGKGGINTNLRLEKNMKLVRTNGVPMQNVATIVVQKQWQMAWGTELGFSRVLLE